MRLKVIFFLVFIPTLSFGQTQSITLLKVAKDYYPYITFLSEGEIEWIDINDDEYKGVSFRIVITTSEIYNKIYLEEVNYGMEGCCKKIISKKEIPIGEIFERFNIDGERTGGVFMEWLEQNSFKIKIQKHTFVISDLNKDIVGIKKLN